MKIFKIFLFSIFLFGVIHNCFAKEEIESQKDDLIKIRSLVKQFDPTAKLVTKENLDTLLNCGEDLKHPGYIKADFKGDGKNGYAVLLSKGEFNIIVVFLKASDENFKPVVIEKEAGDVIEIINKGQKIDANEDLLGQQEGNHVVLKCSGIESVFCEKSSVAYYWDKKKGSFVKVWTAD